MVSEVGYEPTPIFAHICSKVSYVTHAMPHVGMLCQQKLELSFVAIAEILSELEKLHQFAVQLWMTLIRHACMPSTGTCTGTVRPTCKKVLVAKTNIYFKDDIAGLSQRCTTERKTTEEMDRQHHGKD